jgi:hypothetical protein
VDSPGAKASFKFASQIASSYGGRVTFSEGALASSVGNIVESVQKGWIVEVVGPSRKYGEKKLPILELSYAPDPSVFDMKHDFARMAEVPAYLPEFRANDYLYAPNVALFDTEWLRGKAGCDAAPGTAAAKWMMAALVPEAIGRQTAELPTRVAFAAAKTAQEAKRSPKAKKAQASPNLSLQSRLDSQSATAQADPGKAADDQPQERTRLRSQSTEVSGGPKGSTEVCINLPPTTAADGSYLVMVFDPVTKWSGVGILPLSDVLQYQQEHGLTSGQK